MLARVKNFFARHNKLRSILKSLLWLFGILLAVVVLTFGSLQAVCRPSSVPLSSVQNTAKLAEQNSRPEVSTYLTYPEWFIVYSSDEYAQFLSQNQPSHFPYFGSIRQYWGNYCKVYAITKARHEFNAGDHLMLFVIGWSYSVELGLKGVYENTVGRVTELSGTYPATQEDRYADTVAKNYVDFIRLRPWYEYNFFGALGGLWTDTDFFGQHFARKFERKLFLSLEYSVKTVYGWLIGVGSHSVYGVESVDTYAIAQNVQDSVFFAHPEIKKIEQLGKNEYILVIPRYQPFTDIVPQLAKEGVRFTEIAGNHEIFLTALVSRNLSYSPAQGQVVFQANILTILSQKRIALSVPVEFLHQALIDLQNTGGIVEHIYDY